MLEDYGPEVFWMSQRCHNVRCWNNAPCFIYILRCVTRNADHCLKQEYRGRIVWQSIWPIQRCSRNLVRFLFQTSNCSLMSEGFKSANSGYEWFGIELSKYFRWANLFGLNQWIYSHDLAVKFIQSARRNAVDSTQGILNVCVSGVWYQRIHARSVWGHQIRRQSW